MNEFISSPFTFVFDPPYHGEDGFGDANLPPISARLESEHAVNTIIRLAEQYQGSVSINLQIVMCNFKEWQRISFVKNCPF